MNNNFEKERQFVLDLAKQGIDININLSSTQKRYIKNLLLFALMNASSKAKAADEDFIKLVNKLFKMYLVKILQDSTDDDDDEDWEAAISVELNKIIANDNLKKLAELQDVFTPSMIFSFLKKYTNNVSQIDLLKKLRALNDPHEDDEEKDEYDEKSKKKKQNTDIHQNDLLARFKYLRETKTNYRETPEETRKREGRQREYTRALERQRSRERGERTR